MAKITEHLIYSNYQMCEYTNSKIDTSEHIYVRKVTGVKCPHCSAPRDDIEHGQIVECSNCNLNMERLGNTLICTLHTDKEEEDE